jgi:hypothetical protein
MRNGHANTVHTKTTRHRSSAPCAGVRSRSSAKTFTVCTAATTSSHRTRPDPATTKPKGSGRATPAWRPTRRETRSASSAAAPSKSPPTTSTNTYKPLKISSQHSDLAQSLSRSRNSSPPTITTTWRTAAGPREVDLRCECPIIIFFYSFKRVGGHRHTFLQSGQKTFLNFCQLRKYSAGLGSVTAINRHWERVRFRTVRDTIKGTSMIVEKFDIFRRAVQFATSILARAVFYLRPRPSHYLLFGVLARLQIVRQHGEFFLIS